jgi:colicin import membrane protein
MASTAALRDTAALLLADSACAAQARAAARRIANEPGALDLVEHWTDALHKADEAKRELKERQQSLRALASLQGAQDILDDRDQARARLLAALSEAFVLHERRHAEAQHGTKHSEAAALEACDEPLSSYERVRLAKLRSELLPTLDTWMDRINGMREDEAELLRHAERPSDDVLRVLRARNEAWIAATDDLEVKELTERQAAKRRASAPGAADAAIRATREARRKVQSAQRALHLERTRLAKMAAVHFPELFAMEPLLKLGAAEGVDSDELRALLVERELSHYDDRVRISAKDGRHEVIKASYVGEGGEAEQCVLKEYKLDNPSEWKLLAKEVRLLSQLSDCPFIAPIQAVFVQSEPYAAYVQLRLYSGDMRAWLSSEAPPALWRRKALLGQLCDALRHVHSHGIAHGDVKLENVLVALDDDGHRATAHLADFESARQQRANGTRGMSTTTGGGGNQFTELYVAPEIFKASAEGRLADAKPTPMGDMFSYGVCCLFACCLPPTVEAQQQAIRRFAVDDGRKLSKWSRDAAKQADAHLPHLLESLLADAATSEEALARRLSATQTLLHPFHDSEAALAASAAATAAATAAAAAAVDVAAQQMAAVARRQREAEAAVALRQREAEAEAQQRRRQLEEQEEALAEAAEKTARKAADLRTKEKALEDKKKAISAQEKAAAQMEKEASQMKDAAEAAKIAAKEAAAKEKAKVAAAQQALAAEQAETDKKKLELQKEKAKLQADAEKVNSEKRSLEAMRKAHRLQQHSLASSPPMIYLSSSGQRDNLPDLNHAIKAYLQGKVVDGGKVAIVELNDANPDKDPWADQPIYQTVKQHVKDLGYSTEAASYRFFEVQKVTGTKLNDLLDKLAQPGTICIVVGGNTWQLSYSFGQMNGVRATISRQVLCGDLMYVSFSAGSVMAGLTVEINVDPIDTVLDAGGTRTKDGFKLVPYAVRPHNQATNPASQAAGTDFERRLRHGQVKDDAGQVIANCPVLYLKDGEACLFAGVATEPIRLPDKCAKDKIAKLRSFLRYPNSSDAAWSRPAQTIAAGVSKHEIKAHEVGSAHTKELLEFNFACGQYVRLLGTSAKQVTQVDVYESKPVQDAYEQLKAQFFARGFKEETWVFHGTSSAAKVQSICTGGFKVAGQPGGPPIANGAVYGHGIYAATGPSTPMGYGQLSRSVILCLALPGKRGGRQEVDDSWYPRDDWVVFKTGAQLHPKYVVHF